MLEVAWTAPLDLDLISLSDGRWRASDERWIFVDKDAGQLAAVSLDDGSGAWHLPVGEVCELSQVNDAGMIAVRETVSETAQCGQVSLVNTRKGTKLWSVPVENDHTRFASFGTVALSEKTVSATSPCGVERWSASTGKSLGAIKAFRPASKDFPDQACNSHATTGEVALVAEEKKFGGFDVDTGERLWTSTLGHVRLGELHSSDPILVEMSIDGTSGLRRIDARTGAVGALVGRPTYQGVSASFPRFADAIGDAVVGSYDATHLEQGTYRSALRAWSSSSGEELWSRSDAQEQYLGADESGIYVGREIYREADHGGEGYPEKAFWVMRRQGGGAMKAVGWVGDSISSAVRVGDLLLAPGINAHTHARELVAYRLPKAGSKVPTPEPVREDGRHPWKKGEVRPDTQKDPCAAVEESRLEGLGFRRVLELPAPHDCVWVEGPRRFSVQVDVVAPLEQSATDGAMTRIRDLRDFQDETEDVDDLGDEAWMTDRSQVAPGGWAVLSRPSVSTTDVTLGVRKRNVVVTVSAVMKVGDLIADDYRLPWSPDTARAAAIGAATDVLAAVEADVTPPVPQSASDEVTELPPLCGTAAGTVRSVLPKAKQEELTLAGENRLGGCLWSTSTSGFRADFIQVTTYAVGPNPLTGKTGEESASELLEATDDDQVRPLKHAGWDASNISRGSSWDDAARLVVRQDNVILVVQMHRRGADVRGLERPMVQTADQVMKRVRSK